MPSKPTKYPALRVIVAPIETDDATRLWNEAIDTFAEALADRLIAKARAQVAAELGIDEERIDRERGRVVAEVDDDGAGILGSLA